MIKTSTINTAAASQQIPHHQPSALPLSPLFHNRGSLRKFGRLACSRWMLLCKIFCRVNDGKTSAERGDKRRGQPEKRGSTEQPQAWTKKIGLLTIKYGHFPCRVKSFNRIKGYDFCRSNSIEFRNQFQMPNGCHSIAEHNALLCCFKSH